VEKSKINWSTLNKHFLENMEDSDGFWAYIYVSKADFPIVKAHGYQSDFVLEERGIIDKLSNYLKDNVKASNIKDYQEVMHMLGEKEATEVTNSKHNIVLLNRLVRRHRKYEIMPNVLRRVIKFYFAPIANDSCAHLLELCNNKTLFRFWVNNRHYRPGYPNPYTGVDDTRSEAWKNWYPYVTNKCRTENIGVRTFDCTELLPVGFYEGGINFEALSVVPFPHTQGVFTGAIPNTKWKKVDENHPRYINEHNNSEPYEKELIAGTEEWYSSLTGSKLSNALGFGFGKDTKETKIEAMRRVFYNIFDPGCIKEEMDIIAYIRMKYGVEHEFGGIATFLNDHPDFTVRRPRYRSLTKDMFEGILKRYPSKKRNVTLEKVDIVTSYEKSIACNIGATVDGYVYRTKDLESNANTKPIACLEIKCRSQFLESTTAPGRFNYMRAYAFKEVPHYYIPQIMCELAVNGLDINYLVSYVVPAGEKPKPSKEFIIKFDPVLFIDMVTLLEHLKSHFWDVKYKNKKDVFPESLWRRTETFVERCKVMSGNIQAREVKGASGTHDPRYAPMFLDGKTGPNLKWGSIKITGNIFASHKRIWSTRPPEYFKSVDIPPKDEDAMDSTQDGDDIEPYDRSTCCHKVAAMNVWNYVSGISNAFCYDDTQIEQSDEPDMCVQEVRCIEYSQAWTNIHKINGIASFIADIKRPVDEFPYSFSISDVVIDQTGKTKWYIDCKDEYRGYLLSPDAIIHTDNGARKKSIVVTVCESPFRYDMHNGDVGAALLKHHDTIPFKMVPYLQLLMENMEVRTCVCIFWSPSRTTRIFVIAKSDTILNELHNKAKNPQKIKTLCETYAKKYEYMDVESVKSNDSLFFLLGHESEADRI
jgi:hypothetical protein